MKYLSYLFLICLTHLTYADENYPWLENITIPSRPLCQLINTPKNYTRIETKPKSYAYWLQHLPVKRIGTPVYTFDGNKKYNQSAHYAVINIDTGDKDLQQCADAVMRLRAEYLFNQKQFSEIHFNFTSGDKASFSKWAEGYRPQINGNKVKWILTRTKDYSYSNFRKYLTTVFMYAGSFSLNKELKSKDISKIKIGDVFIKGGFPGHAVTVIDIAEHIKSKKKIFMIAQSYMPAQDIHILNNPKQSRPTPWYSVKFEETLKTPEWTFNKSHLKTFE